MNPSAITLSFRCLPELAELLPKPIPAVQGLPDWFKAMPQKAFNPTTGVEGLTVKRCPPFIDAMTYGVLMPLATDLKVENGEFTWNFEGADSLADEHSLSPIDFHDPSQVAGTPLFDDDRFIIKFNNFWTIEAAPGYSLLFTHPVNRADLPFTTLTGLVDCDIFLDSPVHFPARWHDPHFNGVLPKGTPIAQCLPVKRESFTVDCDTLTEEAYTRLLEARGELLRETGVYRRQYRAPKR
jgi:hypothetical protein